MEFNIEPEYQSFLRGYLPFSLPSFPFSPETPDTQAKFNMADKAQVRWAKIFFLITSLGAWNLSLE